MSAALRPEDRRRLTVRVFQPDYGGLVGTIPDYLSCSTTWQRLGVGTASITTTEEGDAALQLLQARDYVVPVVISCPGYPRWSGRVQHFSADRDTGRAGRITATLVDDTVWVKSMLAAPTPAAAWDAQSAEYDTRTGPLVTVAKAYLAANLARLNIEYRQHGLDTIPVAVRPTTGVDSSPRVQLQARNIPVQSLLVDACRTHGYDITAVLWLPGDDQPPGLTLSAPTVVVDVVGPGRNRPYVRFTDLAGGLSARTLAGTHPKALSVLVMGPGEGAARTFRKVWADDGRLATLGRWGLPEDTLEATDLEPTDTAGMDSRGREKLGELAGTASVAPTIDDRRPWVAGPDADYWVNDVVRATFSGVSAEDRIDRFTLTDNRDGFTGTPQFGSARDTETPDAQLARTVAQVREELATMKARR